MIISKQGNDFVCLSKPTPSERKTLIKSGFIFCPIKQKFKTSKTSRAARLRHYFDEQTEKSLRKYCFNITAPWPSRSFKVPAGKKLEPVQKKGVDFILSREHSYLAFDTGVGKTPTSIVAMNTFCHGRENFRVLIVVPPFLVSQWERALLEWQVVDNYKKPNKFLMTSGAFTIGVCDYLIDDLESYSRAQVCTIADSMFTNAKVVEKLKELNFDFMIVDEAHRFCNESKRTEALFSIVHNAYRVCLMSGTPAPNRPIELWPSISNLAWDSIDFMSRERYVKRYCGGFVFEYKPGRYALDDKGSTNESELNSKLKRFMTVEKFEDHYKVKARDEIVVLDSVKPPKKYELLESNIKTNYSIDDAMNNDNLGQLATYRKELAAQKIKPALEYLKNEIEKYPKEQIMIFGIHTELLKTLASKLLAKNFQLIYGGTPNKERDNIQQGFQKGVVRGVVAQVETMVGLDFYKGSRGYFIETPWSPKSVHQARARLVRRGQKNVVHIKHLVLNNSFDEYVLKRVIQKQNKVNEVIR